MSGKQASFMMPNRRNALEPVAKPCFQWSSCFHTRPFPMASAVLQRVLEFRLVSVAIPLNGADLSPTDRRIRYEYHPEGTIFGGQGFGKSSSNLPTIGENRTAAVNGEQLENDKQSTSPYRCSGAVRRLSGGPNRTGKVPLRIRHSLFHPVSSPRRRMLRGNERRNVQSGLRGLLLFECQTADLFSRAPASAFMNRSRRTHRASEQSQTAACAVLRLLGRK